MVLRMGIATRPEYRPSRSTIIRLALAGVLVAAIALAAWRLGYFNLRKAGALLETIGQVKGQPWVVPAYIALFAVLATAALPITPLEIAAGAMYGLGRGLLLAGISGIVASIVGYFAARSLSHADGLKIFRGRDDVGRQLRSRRHGFVNVLRLQLFPVAPFGFVNATAGLARVPFRAYLPATLIGALPGFVAYVYLGDRLASGFGREGHRALIVAAAVAAMMIAISFLPVFRNRRRRASDTHQHP